MTFILILSQEKTAQTKQLLVLVCELYILIYHYDFQNNIWGDFISV